MSARQCLDVVSWFLVGMCLAVSVCHAATGAVADLVVTDAKVYTAAHPEIAAALAVKDGKLIYVGSSQGARAYTGPSTKIVHGGGRLVVPGLVDAHIHPLDIVDLDVCDLHSASKSLQQLATVVSECIAHYRLPPGEWLAVHEWSPTSGNQPDAKLTTLRAALDLAAPGNPVELLGNDGHHAAFNSLALQSARNADGKVIGFSKATLAGDFAQFRALVGLDPQGEPDGMVNEDARYAIDSKRMVYNDLDAVLQVPERITARLNSVGITAILDAEVAPEGLAVYEKLLSTRHMTVRANLALFYDPARNQTADHRVDFDGIIDKAGATRARYATNPLVRADFFKIFADGGAEGNPYATPPTLGNAAMLRPYLQPIFGIDEHGRATVTGYVDPASAQCTQARDNGVLLGQCLISSGQLQHDEKTLFELIRRLHVSGFNLHVHVIGDRTVRTVVDAIESARLSDGNGTTRDSLAHLQFASAEDVRRIGKDRLYVAFTYSWATAEPEYDMTIVPFVQPVSGNGYAQLHPRGSFYEENSYPFRTTKDAGAILVAGSDAPVGTRDPQPFVNMAIAVTRRLPGLPPFNSRQAITIREVLNAYTIDGARFLGRESEIGSLEVGKSADFVLLDRDILSLADSGHPEAVYDTRVLGTWFRGRRVFNARLVGTHRPF